MYFLNDSSGWCSSPGKIRISKADFLNLSKSIVNFWSSDLKQAPYYELFITKEINLFERQHKNTFYRPNTPYPYQTQRENLLNPFFIPDRVHISFAFLTHSTVDGLIPKQSNSRINFLKFSNFRQNNLESLDFHIANQHMTVQYQTKKKKKLLVCLLDV